jgi:hypothetical protein
MKRAFLPVASACSLLALATPCLAQEADVTLSAPAPAAPAAAPPAATVVVAPPSPSLQATATRDEAADARGRDKGEKKDEEEKDSAHFRFGMGLDADYLLAPGSTGIQGFGAGLELRLGAQVNQWFAVYYQPHAIVGGTLSIGSSVVPGTPGLPSANLIGAVFNSGLAELTLPILHLGAGPSADIIGVKNYSLTTGVANSFGAYFGIDGRAAIVIGGHGPGRHLGFAINANVHPTFWNGIVFTTFSLGIGGEMY